MALCTTTRQHRYSTHHPRHPCHLLNFHSLDYSDYTKLHQQNTHLIISSSTMLRGCPCDTSRQNPYSLSKFSHPRTLNALKANIVLPQGNIKVPLSTICKRVPGGYEKFRSANLGRNIDPLQDLGLFISSGEDLEVVELAMQWIFSHVKFDRTLECTTTCEWCRRPRTRWRNA